MGALDSTFVDVMGRNVTGVHHLLKIVEGVIRCRREGIEDRKWKRKQKENYFGGCNYVLYFLLLSRAPDGGLRPPSGVFEGRFAPLKVILCTYGAHFQIGFTR